MRKFLGMTGRWITIIIDFFYPPFRKYMTLQLFRYAVTGVANLVFDWFMYFFIFNFVLEKRMLYLGFITLSSHIATLAIKFPITLTSGFLLQKYVTFSESLNKGREQLFRYYLIAFVNLGLNYVGLKLLVDGFHFFPSIANIILSVLITIFSYISQKKFTFKLPNPNNNPEK